MIAAHALGINHQVRRQLTQEITPGCFRKLRVEQKFFELAHHGRLAHDRRIQTANHFEHECVSLLTTKDFNCGWNEILAFDSFNQIAIVGLIEKENSAQAGLHFETFEHRGHLVPGLAPKVDYDQLVNHGLILENPPFRLSSVCHEK